MIIKNVSGLDVLRWISKKWQGNKTIEDWLKFVAENQFTLEEMANGTAYETLKYQNDGL